MRNILLLLILLFSFVTNGQSKFDALREQLVENKTYEYVYGFENDYAVFRTFKGKMGLIDSLGNVVLKPNYAYIENRKELKDIFEAGIIANKNFKRGFIDLQGNTKIPFEYEDVYYLGNNLIRVSKNNKYGVVDIHNKIILPIKYPIIMSSNGVLFVQNNNTVDLFDAKGKQITNFQAFDIEYFQHKRSIVTLQNKNTFIIDTLGNIILNTIKNHTFERILSQDTFLILNTLTKNKGIINSNGKYEIECKYDEIYTHHSTYIVKSNGKEGLIDKKGSILKPLIYHTIYAVFSKDTISFQNHYYAYKNNLRGIINPYQEKEIIPISYKYIDPFYNYYIVTNSENKDGLLSAKGEIIIPEDYDFYSAARNKIFAVKNSKKYLLTIENNNYTETEIFVDEFAKENLSFRGFSKSNYQIFKDKSKFGVFSNKNKIALLAEYDAITEIYGTGEFVVKKNNKYGIVNSDNEIQLELKYDSFQIIKESVRFNIKNPKTVNFYPVKYPFEPQ
ncbi:MAG: WG repeat-containing protein [Flavobacterium nitrogenifigens]|uniref:WG repeat-containing protein n=1 Tax=Flavobacterium nitrogenifigens TaxID=1617283 RepID=UPI0028098C3B|nr:WG repeat-containing protein [Flavobacterium nitrogenifigens]MDQ8014802.1 WG repeat-containing protein [Flavobacterium nitrogenifigens]